MSRHTSFGGNSGYVGYSQSVRAAQAKAEGRYPKTLFKQVHGISEKKFKELEEREVICVSEWHHTSKYGNKTYFYSISNEILFFLLTGQKEEAIAAYKRTRNYEVPIRRHINRNIIRFLDMAADYAFENKCGVGKTFTFKGQELKVVSKTKHRKYPVCKLSK